jgi:hypothetical protein
VYQLHSPGLDVGRTLYLPHFISGSEGGWHHIAWAFLKPVGVNGVLNTEKEVRLQLYKPRRMRKLSCNSCDVCYSLLELFKHGSSYRLSLHTPNLVI